MDGKLPACPPREPEQAGNGGWLQLSATATPRGSQLRLSRGEMTDVAMAAWAECIMLNKGPFVTDAVHALDRLLTRIAEHQDKKTPKLRALHSW